MEKNKEPKVAIITPTFSQDELLKKNLQSLKRMDYENWELYLIDDASEKSLGKKMKSLFPWINLITNKQNQGFAVSNNKGFKKAIKEFNPDYFLMWNDDCEVLEKNWLNRLVDFAESKKKGGLFGCQVVYPDKSLQWFSNKGRTKLIRSFGSFSENLEIDKIQEVTNILGACILIKKKVFKEIGFLDEGFSPFYGEETDFCFRAKKKKLRIYYHGGIKVVHHGNKSISKLSQETVWFIKKKNSIRLEWRHYSFFKNIYYTLVHFGSIFKRDGIKIIKKLNLLIKAYGVNLREWKSKKNQEFQF